MTPPRTLIARACRRLWPALAREIVRQQTLQGATEISGPVGAWGGGPSSKIILSGRMAEHQGYRIFHISAGGGGGAACSTSWEPMRSAGVGVGGAFDETGIVSSASDLPAGTPSE